MLVAYQNKQFFHQFYFSTDMNISILLLNNFQDKTVFFFKKVFVVIHDDQVSMHEKTISTHHTESQNTTGLGSIIIIIVDYDF